MKSGKKKLNDRTAKRSVSAEHPAELERRALALPRRVVLEAERALFHLREAGQRVSFSALVEVALREILTQEDLGAILERHGAKARRD